MKIKNLHDAAQAISDNSLYQPLVESLVASIDLDDYSPEYSDNVPFLIPVVLPEGIHTGDTRFFEVGITTVQDLPIPLLWQIKTGSGHDGSYVVGRIDSIERLDPIVHGYDGLGMARGVMDSGPLGREATRLIRGQFIRGVSADLDQFEGTVDEGPETELSDKRSIKNDAINIHQARIRAVTIVAKPSFPECTIMIDDPVKYIQEVDAVDDGIYMEEYDDDDLYLSAVTASAIPVVPPRSWFNNPELRELTPITVSDDGRVFGHVAAWSVNHIGLPRATKPPRSASNYRYFRTGVLRTDDGSDIPVGQLTLTGGHPDLHLSAREAVAHYDDTRSAAVDVNIGEDRHGIWVAGALRPELLPEQIRALRASAPSGDWRPIEGRLELVAVACVNTPGFPVARSLVAGGQVMALVAAGARPVAERRSNPTEDRLNKLESIEFARQIAEAEMRMAPHVAQHEEALVASALHARETLEAFSSKELDILDQRVQALRERMNNTNN